MKKYYVYFDAFGKKLKVRVGASSPEEAAIYVRKSINIEKIEEDKSPPRAKTDFDKFGDDFKDIFESFFKK
jgi:hypothetical protein